MLFRGQDDGIGIAGDGIAQPDRRRSGIADLGGGGVLGSVAGQDRGEDVDCGGWQQGLGSISVVRVAVAGGGEVEVVGRPGRG